MAHDYSSPGVPDEVIDAANEATDLRNRLRAVEQALRLERRQNRTLREGLQEIVATEKGKFDPFLGVFALQNIARATLARAGGGTDD